MAIFLLGKRVKNAAPETLHVLVLLTLRGFLTARFFGEGKEEFCAVHIAFESTIEDCPGELVAVVANGARGCLGEPVTGAAPEAFFSSFGWLSFDC